VLQPEVESSDKGYWKWEDRQVKREHSTLLISSTYPSQGSYKAGE